MNSGDARGLRSAAATAAWFARIDPANEHRPRIALSEGDIDVWPLALQATDQDAQRWSEGLSPAERARSERFFRASDRVAFIVAHGAMRRVLAAYCDVLPEALEIGTAHNGKPCLEGASAAADIRFNLAHSGRCALLAVARHQDVGVDVEAERDDVGALALAGRYFFGTEREAIVAAPSSAQVATFFRYWVAKESVLKAEGVGLRFPLDGFRVDFAGDGQTATVQSSDRRTLSDRWRVSMLAAPSGWQAALACIGECRIGLRDAAAFWPSREGLA